MGFEELLLYLSNLFFLFGALFFLIGTIALFRFVDLYTRLHALAKIDNLGLGFIVLGLLCQAPGIFAALKLLLIWVLTVFGSATLSYILSNHAKKSGKKPVLDCRVRD